MKSTCRIVFNVFIIILMFPLFSFTTDKTVSFSFTTDKSETGWSEYNLRGKVKSLTEISYEVVERNGKIEIGERKRGHRPIQGQDYQIVFDNNGNKIVKIEYASDGSIENYVTYEYNKKGNKIEENVYDSDRRLERKWIYKYNNIGNLIEETYYFDGSLTSKRTNEYDKKGNRIEANIVNYIAGFEQKVTFEYDNEGNLIETNWYSSGGRTTSKLTNKYKYDNKGNKIEENRYAFDSIFIFKRTYEYDNKGNQIERNQYDADGRVVNRQSYEYDYDKQGNWTWRIEFVKEAPKHMALKQGTWIKRIEYVNETPRFILVREIEYFD